MESIKAQQKKLGPHKLVHKYVHCAVAASQDMACCWGTPTLLNPDGQVIAKGKYVIIFVFVLFFWSLSVLFSVSNTTWEVKSASLHFFLLCLQRFSSVQEDQ